MACCIGFKLLAAISAGADILCHNFRNMSAEVSLRAIAGVSAVQLDLSQIGMQSITVALQTGPFAASRIELSHGYQPIICNTCELWTS